MSLTDILTESGTKLKQAAIGAYVSLPAIAQAGEIDSEGLSPLSMTLLTCASSIVGATVGTLTYRGILSHYNIPPKSRKANMVGLGIALPAIALIYLGYQMQQN